MLGLVKKYVPTSWSDTASSQCDVASYTEEYREMEADVRAAVGTHVNIRRLIRVQDVYAYGQYLLREQLLLNCGLTSQLYRVRRCIKVNSTYKNNIITYNLDPRRCGMGNSLQFYKNLSWDDGYLLVFVKVLTNTPNANVIEPSSSSEYFVEYIVELQ